MHWARAGWFEWGGGAETGPQLVGWVGGEEVVVISADLCFRGHSGESQER